MSQRVRASAVSVSDADDVFVEWGVAPGPWLWPTTLRILFVIDGRIGTSTGQGAFGLGYVLETLRDPSFAWWVQFKVQVVRRDFGEIVISAPQPDNNYNQPGQPAPTFATTGFTFTEPGFNLDHWDQVWFFGDYPANLSDDIHDPSHNFYLLTNDELKLLAEWMDRGGGVFATGDHWNLGAAMCSRIPRVRTMRKWLPEQGIPTIDGITRNQTLQPGATGHEDVLEEGDATPQPIELVYRSRAASILARPMMAHPLLSATTGVIDHFPDHMHEGEVIEDDRVQLETPLGIPGYQRPEYPSAEPQSSAALVPGAPDVELPWARPRPHVVAHARTTNKKNILTPSPPVVDHAVARVVDVRLSTVRFAILGAYDGDRVGIGRVVVDSTWHHWFSYNLHGFASDNPAQYALMQAYYRNVALWLATPAKRRSMLVGATWGTVVADPMAFPQAPRRSVWAVGQRAVGVISHTLSQPMLLDFVGSLFAGRAEELFGVPGEQHPAEPYAGSVPTELAARAIVGGIATSLIEPAFDYLQAKDKPRRLLDTDAIGREAEVGLELGQRTLVGALQASATASTVIVDRLEHAFQPPKREAIPVDLVALRVVAERLQLPDPTDPVLGGGRFTIAVRLSLGQLVSTEIVISDIEVPSFGPGGAIVELDRVLYDGVVQTGETLTVEIVIGEAGANRSTSDDVRFAETIDGDPSAWVGAHTPSRSHPWRLWYRIERVDEGQ